MTQPQPTPPKEDGKEGKETKEQPAADEGKQEFVSNCPQCGFSHVGSCEDMPHKY